MRKVKGEKILYILINLFFQLGTLYRKIKHLGEISRLCETRKFFKIGVSGETKH